MKNNGPILRTLIYLTIGVLLMAVPAWTLGWVTTGNIVTGRILGLFFLAFAWMGAPDQMVPSVEMTMKWLNLLLAIFFFVIFLFGGFTITAVPALVMAFVFGFLAFIQF
jgi:hypothetical protein